MAKTKLVDKVTLSLVILVILGTLIFHLVKNKNIADNKQQTTGKILKIRHISKARYSLDYQYYVEGEKYIGSVGIYYFECTNDNGCKSYEIDVFYSSEEPQYSQVDLRKFEKYKTTVYFIE